MMFSNIFDLIQIIGYCFFVSFLLQLIGFLWYGPLFGKIYIETAHLNKTLQSPPKSLFIKCFSYTFIIVLLYTYLISSLPFEDLFYQLKFSFCISSIIALFSFIHDLFDGRPVTLTMLHSLYNGIMILTIAFVWFCTSSHFFRTHF